MTTPNHEILNEDVSELPTLILTLVSVVFCSNGGSRVDLVQTEVGGCKDVFPSVNRGKHTRRSNRTSYYKS